MRTRKTPAQKPARTKNSAGPTYYLVQTDDEGTRRIGSGFSSPRAAASSIAGVVEWLDDEAIETLSSTWNAASPSGGERFAIGQDD